MWTQLGRRPLRMPFGPETTEVKEASSAKLEMMMSALAAAAAGVSAIAAPAARSGSALAGVLFQTTSGYPARWILVAIASPIRPRPMKAMAFPLVLAEISILPELVADEVVEHGAGVATDGAV